MPLPITPSQFYEICDACQVAVWVSIRTNPFSYLTTFLHIDYQVFVRLHFDAFSKTFINLRLYLKTVLEQLAPST